MSLFFLELKDSGKKLIPPKEWQCKKDSGKKLIPPKEWQCKIELLITQKQMDIINKKVMLEELKFV